ncbi:MAG: hypothetical protein CUN56_00690 [Phototrophicales bacterium]|nr:MAG: hypothetical protein CUN56_00690 [Phototrophicales bacterium]
MVMRRFIGLIILILSLGVVSTTAQVGNTIAEIVAFTPRYSTLWQAVQLADPIVEETLSEDGPLTLLAPTNQAFINLAAAFDADLDTLLADRDLLTQLLLYHIVDGRVTYQDLVEQDGQLINPLLPDTAFRVSVQNGELRLNDVVRVVNPYDLQATNGIIHTVRDMIYPFELQAQLEALADAPSPTRTPAPSGSTDNNSDTNDTDGMGGGSTQAFDRSEVETVATFPSQLTLAGRIFGDPRYSTLALILEEAAPDYARALNAPDAALTLFAPTNGAFDNLFYTLGIDLDNALDNPELLNWIIAYHVVDGVLTAEEIADFDGDTLQTIFDNGDFVESIRVAVVGRRITLNEVVQIKSSDLGATNGIMHSVDNVLIPQAAIDALIEAGLWEADEP